MQRDQSKMRPQLFPRLTGGLDTKSPPTQVDPSGSPDLQNVTFQNYSVGRRGGFPPLVRTQPKLNSIENTGCRAMKTRLCHPTKPR